MHDTSRAGSFAHHPFTHSPRSLRRHDAACRRGGRIVRRTLALLVPLFVGTTAAAQPLVWEPVGNLVGELRGLAVTNAGELYAIGRHNVYYSRDRGTSWDCIDAVRMDEDIMTGEFVAIAALSDGTVLCALDASRMWSYRSGVRGDDLTFDRPDVVTDTLGLLAVDARDNIYAAIGDGLFRATLMKRSWAGLHRADGLRSATSFATSTQGTLLVGMRDGLLRSTDAGAHWSDVGGNLPRRSVSGMAATPDGSIWAASRDGFVARSTDDGITWARRDAGPAGVECNGIVAIPPHSLATASVSGTLHYSRDAGHTWSAAAGVPPGASCDHIVRLGGDTLFAVAGIEGIIRSTDAGRTWTMRNAGLQCRGVSAVVARDSATVFACIGNEWRLPEGVAMSNDGGKRWHDYTGSLRGTPPDVIAISGSGFLYAATPNGALFRRRVGGSGEWRAVGMAPAESADTAAGRVVMRILASPDIRSDVVAVLEGDALHCSTDNGDTWESVEVPGEPRIHAAAIGRDATIYLANNTLGLYRIRHDGTGWHVLPPFAPAFPFINDLAVTLGGTLLAVGPYDGQGGCAPGLYASRDGGETWQGIAISEGHDCTLMHNVSGKRIMAALDNAYVIWSDDEGGTWRQRNAFPDAGITGPASALGDGTLLAARPGRTANTQMLHRASFATSAPGDGGVRIGMPPLDSAYRPPIHTAYFRTTCDVLESVFFLPGRGTATLVIDRGPGQSIATIPLGELNPGTHALRHVLHINPRLDGYRAVLLTPFGSDTASIRIY